jgi:hypothetical protein
MEFLIHSKESTLKIKTNDYGRITWDLGAAFGVNKDLRSYTGAVMKLGDGIIKAISTKQKVNYRSWTETELISMHDILSRVLWTKLFMEAQGCKIIEKCGIQRHFKRNEIGK